MYLIDSNIIIYSYSNEFEHLRSILTDDSAHISEVSCIEVLGYHKLSIDEDHYFSTIFRFIPPLSLSQQVIDEAIKIRKIYNLKLGDALIAATALVHNLTLYTRNQNDFKNVVDLRCINPIA
jgi:predicted nucleic acid-binding protein